MNKKQKEFENILANQNVTPGNQPPDEKENIQAYPVSKERFDYISSLINFKSKRTVNGVDLYRIKQIDVWSDVEIVFDIYIDPELDTNFTEIKSIPIELSKKTEK